MIAANGITMRFGKKALFENVSIKFKEGNRYGLIGANGAGKSTFMKILTGELEASAGEVAIDQGCSIGYLRQQQDAFDDFSILDTVYQGNEKLWKVHTERESLYSKTELTPEEEEAITTIEERFEQVGGYTMEADASRLLIGLGFPEEKHLDTMTTLTGGYKVRVLLAQALFGQPDILLLDEPTNYLDMASRDWLETFLQRYNQGTVIVISHDRYFLNQVCTHIADLDYERIRLFPGNYDEFMTTNEMLLDKIRKENVQKEKRIAELKGFINRFSANASKAKQATARQKELEKIDLSHMKPSSRQSPYIRFEVKERLGDRVMEGKSLAKSYDFTLFEDVSLTFGRDEKIAIIGGNGVGKTTLLKILLKRLDPDKGTVAHGSTVDLGYFPQDTRELLDPKQTAYQWLSQFAPDDEEMKETEVRSAMGRMLFKGDAALKPIKVLSGGERARLILSAMIMQGANVLALDEPTNHLDLESIESLNYALSLFENTVLFVSHDREFIRSLATRILEIKDGTVTDYPGTLEEFEAWKKKQKKLAKADA